MAHKERKILYWLSSQTQFPPAPGNLAELALDPASGEAEAKIVEHLDAGWQVVSHTFSEAGDSSLLLTLLVERETSLPDTFLEMDE